MDLTVDFHFTLTIIVISKNLIFFFPIAYLVKYKGKKYINISGGDIRFPGEWERLTAARGRAHPPAFTGRGSQTLPSYCLNQNCMIVFCDEMFNSFSRLCPNETKITRNVNYLHFLYNKYLENIWNLYIAASITDQQFPFICSSLESRVHSHCVTRLPPGSQFSPAHKAAAA